MSEPTRDLLDPVLKEIGDLAVALQLAKPSMESGEPEGAGAVFLIGAGCSVSAGIKPAAGVAQHCAMKLARKLSKGDFVTHDADAALTWLIEQKRIDLPAAKAPRQDGSHWGDLYSYFFENFFQSANMQREIISAIVAEGKGQLNWAHACLGELVRLGFVHTVLTTNFDQLVLQGIIRTGRMPVIADGLEAINRIVGRPKQPQVVHLHGSMHTYDLRNSAESMAETSRNDVAKTMVHTLMQECDLLVVVGYRGGEEGIMTLLKEAGRVRSKLVVYWVTYTPSLDSLSVDARELLQGENKFVVRGGTADRFFGQLMSEMRLGEPEWVRDPIGAMAAQSVHLIAPTDEFTEVRVLVDAFRARVEHANLPTQRLDEQDLRKVQAATARARGDFLIAYNLLETADRENDVEAARLHALNALSLCEMKQDKALLQVAMDELSHLVTQTKGETQLEVILSLGQALLLSSEYTAQSDSASEAASAPLEEVEQMVEQALPKFAAHDFPLGNARLNLLKAQVLQSQGEREPIDVQKLESAQTAYKLALAGLAAVDDPSVLLIEAKAGLASTIQVIGEATGNLDLLRDAVIRHREVVDLSPRTERSLEDAGPLSNLAGALMALAFRENPRDQVRLYEEARDVLRRVVMLHQHDGNDLAAEDVRKTIAQIDTSLGE